MTAFPRIPRPARKAESMSAPHEQGALGASLSDPMTQPQEQGASAARTAGLTMVLLPMDDPHRPLPYSDLPPAMIRAGGDAFHRLKRDRSLDADSCSLAVGIYRAMTEAHAREIATLSPSAALASRADTAEMTAGASAVAQALRAADWGGASIGNKALIAAAISELEATPAPATPPGVPDAGGSQVIAQLGPHFHAQPRARDAQNDENWASWSRPHDVYTTDPSVCRAGRILVGTLSFEAVGAWQRAIASPGVPDSVRALVSAAYDAGFEASGEGWNSEYPGDHKGNAHYEKPKREYLDSISAHPAGQSTGLGAGWTTPHPGPVSRQTEAAARRIAARRAGGAYADAPAVSEAAWRSEIHAAEAALFGLPAPDSTRTGPVGTEEAAKAEVCRIAKAIYEFDRRYAAFPEPWDRLMEASRAPYYSLAHEIIAARPAAPEAQGAERVRHVKRGMEYEVLGEAEAQVSVTEPGHRKGIVRHIQDGDRLTVYRGSDGKLWCRFTDEFRDGRFEPAPSSGQGGR